MSVIAAARRYAEALADVALGAGKPDQIDRELKGFADIVAANPELRNLFASPVVSLPEKRRVLDAIVDRTRPSANIANLLGLLLRHYRLHNVDVVYEQFRREMNKRRGIVPAEVTTSAPLEPPDEETLRARLQEITGQPMELRFKTDPSLIGGTITRVGSVVYDASVRTQLHAIKQALKGGKAPGE